MRLRIAEIGEHPVAHVLGDEAPIALDQACAAFVISPNDPPHVLGIEPCRHCGRADEIAENDGQLPALGGVVGGRFSVGILCDSGPPGWRARKLRDSRQHHPPMPDDDDAKVLQVFSRQLRQNLAVDRVLAKSGLVLAEAETSQPVSHVHGGGPEGSRP